MRGDTAQAAKAISTFNKEHDVLTFKGGFMEEISVDEDAAFKVESLKAASPATCSTASSPASSPARLAGLVRGLGSMIPEA